MIEKNNIMIGPTMGASSIPPFYDIITGIVLGGQVIIINILMKLLLLY